MPERRRPTPGPDREEPDGADLRVAIRVSRPVDIELAGWSYATWAALGYDREPPPLEYKERPGWGYVAMRCSACDDLDELIEAYVAGRAGEGDRP